MEILLADLSHAAAFDRYVLECASDPRTLYTSAEVNDSLGYLKKRISWADVENTPADWVPCSTYFCFEKGEIVGSIRVRHGTTDYIESVIGHIGFETRASAQGKGVATKMLKWILQNKTRGRNIISCESDNIASQKVIEKCGGEFLGTFVTRKDEMEVKRFEVHGISNE
jgi:predicted acetyltransferase